MNLPVVLRLLSLRYFRRHRLRTLLALGSIALGVGAFLAMAALNRGVLESFEQTARARAAGADAIVQAGRAGVPTALADELRALPGVRAATPYVLRPVDLAIEEAASATRRNVLLVGVDVAALPDELLPFPRAVAKALDSPIATLLAGAVPIALPRALADGWRHADGRAVAVGDVLQLTAGGPPRPVRVAVIVDPAEHAKVPRGVALAATTVGARLADALRLVPGGGTADACLLWFAPAVAAAEGSGRAALEERVRAVLDGRAELLDPAEQAHEYDATLGSFRIALRFVALLSLVIAAFLVHSTLAMALAERRRELSIVRCLGLAAAPLRALLIAEAAVIGASGALLGLPLGRVLAHAMGELFWGTVGQTFDRIDVVLRAPSLGEASLGVAAGVVAALIAVLPPTFAVARQPPLAGWVEARGETRTPAARSRRGAQVALLLLAVAALLYAGHGFALPHAGYGVVALLIGALALGAPALLRGLLRGVGPALLRLGGVAARLARDHCRRAISQSALTVVAIALGFGLVFSTDLLVKSYVRLLERWFTANVGEDLLVMGRDFVGSGLMGSDFPQALNRDLAAIPGVLHSHGLRFSRITHEGERVLLFAFDAGGPPEAGTPEFVAGDRTDEGALARGEGCFVSEGFARRFGKWRGATVTVASAGGSLPLPVLAVVEDYLWPRGSIWVDDDLYRRAFHDEMVQEFALTLDGSRPLADVQRDVAAAIAGNPDALVADAHQVQQDVMGIVARYWSLLLAQEGLAVAVAFLGTLHALLVSVLLRRRELALLRALGTPLVLVARMLRTEGALLGFAGGVMGVAFGLAAAAIALRLISLEEMGFAVPLAWSWWGALATVAAATFTGWLAGLLPGRRAAAAAPRTALLDTMD